MSVRRVVLLEIAEARADELLSALSKRDYLKVVALDRNKPCPLCSHKFSPPQKVVVTQDLLAHLIAIAEKMTHFKSLVLTNQKLRADDVSVHEKPRCLEVPHKYVLHAEVLELVKSYVDGRITVHHLTEKGMRFLLGESVSPSKVILIEGKIESVDKTPVSMEQVKFKDRIDRDKLVTRAKMVIGQWPIGIRGFVEKGQVSLLV